jgi:hypothetical protein
MVLLGHGRESAGHDISWSPVTGGAVVIERKDRAWDPGARETIDGRLRYIVGQIRQAGPRMPHRAGVARVLTIGLPGFVTAADVEDVREIIDSHLSAELSPTASPETCPDCLVIDMLGGEHTEGGAYIPWSFSHMLDFGFGRTEWLAVRRAFRRAFTIDGALEPGPPWRIEADYLPPDTLARGPEGRRR